LIIQDQPLEASLHQLAVKIKQQPSLNAAQTHVSEQPGFMDLLEAIHGLEFNDQGSGDNQVHSIAAVELDALVGNRKWHLPFKWQATELQFMAKAFLIGRFEKARAKNTMNLNGSSNDFLREQIGERLFLRGRFPLL